MRATAALLGVTAARNERTWRAGEARMCAEEAAIPGDKNECGDTIIAFLIQNTAKRCGDTSTGIFVSIFPLNMQRGFEAIRYG
jgi:hypothetical protein